jgi:hypothetical protein
VQRNSAGLLVGIRAHQKVLPEGGERREIEISRNLLGFPRASLVLRAGNKGSLALVGQVAMKVFLVQRRVGEETGVG